jgi:hypothetical protein
MNQFSKFQHEIDDALSQSARDLRRLAEFYRRHGKIEYANQVEQSLTRVEPSPPKEHLMRDQFSTQVPNAQSPTSKTQEKPQSSQFHWLHLPAKKVG